VILDTKGNIFGGFTPVKWELKCGWKADDSLKSFVFTLKNPHNIPARRFALKAEWKKWAICCYSRCCQRFGYDDIFVYNDSNADCDSFTSLGSSYTNDTGLDGDSVFTGAPNFGVTEIEVFEIAA
jgi:hypothetical protein